MRHKQVSTETKTEIGDFLLPKLPFTQRWEPLVTAMANPSIKHVFVHLAALYRIRRGNKRPFFFFTSRPQAVFLSYSVPSSASGLPWGQTPCPYGIKTLHHWWQRFLSLCRFMISNSWQMDPRLGLPQGEAPRLIFFKPQKRKGVKKGGAKQGWRWERRSYQDCQKHFQGCHLGWVGPFKLSVILQQEPLPIQKDKSVGGEGLYIIITV